MDVALVHTVYQRMGIILSAICEIPPLRYKGFVKGVAPGRSSSPRSLVRSDPIVSRLVLSPTFSCSHINHIQECSNFWSFCFRPVHTDHSAIVVRICLTRDSLKESCLLFSPNIAECVFHSSLSLFLVAFRNFLRRPTKCFSTYHLYYCPMVTQYQIITRF